MCVCVCGRQWSNRLVGPMAWQREAISRVLALMRYDACQAVHRIPDNTPFSHLPPLAGWPPHRGWTGRCVRASATSARSNNSTANRARAIKLVMPIDLGHSTCVCVFGSEKFKGKGKKVITSKSLFLPAMTWFSEMEPQKVLAGHRICGRSGRHCT